MANQGDVRKKDKYNIRDMPEKEARRVQRSEEEREREAYIDSGEAAQAEHRVLGFAARARPRMTMQDYDRNPIAKQARREMAEAEERATSTGSAATRVQRGTDDYQYADGGPVNHGPKSGVRRLKAYKKLVSKYAKGGRVSCGDGCAIRGRTKGRMV
jgi:hypothetical protein